jgi:hypothetical protein
MILDERLEFADATALSTAGTSTYNVGDIIDMGGTTNYIGGSNSRQMYLVIQVTTAVAGTSSTVTFRLVSDATSTIATDGSATQHLATDAIAEATLVAGYEIVFALPSGAYERYLALQTSIGEAALSAGAVNAFLTYDPPHSNIAFPDASN